MAISGPQLRHDNIIYFGNVSFNINGTSSETKTLEYPKYSVGEFTLRAPTSRLVGEAKFILPKEGDVSITVLDLGYNYKTPEGTVTRVSRKKDKFDIKELK